MRRQLRRRRSLGRMDENSSDEDDATFEEIPTKGPGRFVKLGNTVYRVQGSEDSAWMTALEILGILFTFLLLYYSYYHYDNLHFHVSRGYAHLGYPSAQHVVGQRYLTGKGIDRNDTAAMQWFRAAADQGHAEASYNLAVGHMQGAKTDLRRGEPEKLLRFAAENGIQAANHALNLCARRGCD